MGRYEEYSTWQDKVLEIGSSIRERHGFIDERDRKLLEEMTEVAIRAKGYFDVHPERRKHHEKERDDAIEEMYDSINVMAIVLGIVNEPIPKHLMLQQLLMHHPKYRTRPRVRSFRSDEKEYSDGKIFRLWEKELLGVNENIKENIRNGDYSMDERFDVVYNNLLRCIKEIERSVSTLPTEYGELLRIVEDKKIIVHPLSDLKMSGGDFINNTSICMGILDQALPPYPEMYKKLVLRDARYGTG